MKTQNAINWVLSSLIIVAAVAVVSMSGVRVQAASETAPMTFAQAQIKKNTQDVGPGRGAPGSIKGNPKAAKVLCGGKTTAECCKGISYCGCLANPMPKKGDEDKPLSCESSPPPKG
jgi:hypothetical protein